VHGDQIELLRQALANAARLIDELSIRRDELDRPEYAGGRDELDRAITAARQVERELRASVDQLLNP
jgi:hypothetical protein